MVQLIRDLGEDALYKLTFYITLHYISGAVLAWLSVWSEVQTAYGPADATSTSLSFASVKSRLVSPFWYRLIRVVPDRGLLNGCVCVCVYAVGVSGDSSVVEVCNADRRTSQQASQPVCTTEHQPHRTQGESEGCTYLLSVSGQCS